MFDFYGLSREHFYARERFLKNNRNNFFVEALNFVKSFRRKECVHFVTDPARRFPVCFCGAPEDEHKTRSDQGVNVTKDSANLTNLCAKKCDFLFLGGVVVRRPSSSPPPHPPFQITLILSTKLMTGMTGIFLHEAIAPPKSNGL
jgi:hypothetical protein